MVETPRSTSRNTLTDRQLKKIAREFRDGLLDGRDSSRMCFAVCAPLQALLSACGVETELVTEDFCCTDHVWLRLPDGRILDPTADQFDFGLPPIYLGPLPDAYRREMDTAAIEDAQCPEVSR